MPRKFIAICDEDHRIDVLCRQERLLLADYADSPNRLFAKLRGEHAPTGVIRIHPVFQNILFLQFRNIRSPAAILEMMHRSQLRLLSERQFGILCENYRMKKLKTCAPKTITTVIRKFEHGFIGKSERDALIQEIKLQRSTGKRSSDSELQQISSLEIPLLVADSLVTKTSIAEIGSNEVHVENSGDDVLDVIALQTAAYAIETNETVSVENADGNAHASSAFEFPFVSTIRKALSLLY